MADHIDKQIRDAATTLLTGLSTTGANVFKSRVYPLQDSELPALRVYVDGSSIEVKSIGGANRVVEREIELVVEFCDKVITSYDDHADASKKEVEQAIANSNTLTGKVKYAQLARIETERDGESDKVIQITRMIFLCAAYTALNAPDVPL
jgi:hypothetical protein